MIDNNESTGVPEVKSEQFVNKKIIALVSVVIVFILLIYVNISSGKSNNHEQDIDLSAPVLNFNETPPPLLVDNKLSNNQQFLLNKQQYNTETDGQPKGSNDFSNVDPVKLMQFKQMMDEANQEKMNEINQRRKTSTLIVNVSVSDTAANVGTYVKSEKNQQSVSNISIKDTEVVNAARTSNLSSTILEGTIVHATLETAVNSDLPGSMRAVINRTVYSADGINKLLNPGDRLVMQYTSKLTQGATRIFAIGSRIIKADGISINLGSPVTSPLGVSGLGSDSVDTHFFARFGEAALLAVISAGAATWDVGAKDELNSASLYRQGIADSFSNTANETLQANAGRPPTLYVNQGKEITVFVAKDISFADVYGRLL